MNRKSPVHAGPMLYKDFSNMKNYIKVSLLLCFVFRNVCDCSTNAVNGIEIATLRIDRVEMRLGAPVKELSQREIEDFFAKVRKKTGLISMAYALGGTTGFSSYNGCSSYIWAFSDKAKEAQKMLEEIATEPFKKWEITLQVHGGGQGSKGKVISDSDDSKQIKTKREEILKSQIKWRDKVTIGDVLQTLGDNLGITVVIKDKLLAKNGNDWQALLSKSLDVKKTENVKTLTLDDLISLLKKQLNATVELDDFLRFNALEPDTDENLN
jgi:hypothetical protein